MEIGGFDWAGFAMKHQQMHDAKKQCATGYSAARGAIPLMDDKVWEGVVEDPDFCSRARAVSGNVDDNMIYD